jgi:exosortase A
MTVIPSAQQSELPVRASSLAEWRRALALTGVAIAIFAVGFHQEAADAVGVWIASTAYNHCFLVLPVVAYLLWERRSIIAACSPQPALWPLFLMPLLSVAWLVAAALDIKEGRQLLVVAMFEGVLLSALGLRVYRLLLAPLLFLFFLVPTGSFLVPALQSITADSTVFLLQLLRVPVFSDGYTIEIPGAVFAIVEACAGLRFLVAASVFACLFAVVMYRGWMRRAIYIALSIAVAIGANVVRAFGIVYLAYLTGAAQAVAADHVLYGFLFLSIVIALLISIGMLFAESGVLPPPSTTRQEKPPPRWHLAAVPLAALLAMTGPAFAAWQNSRAPSNPLAVTGGPEVAAPWQVRAASAADWRPVVRGADREYLDAFDGPDLASVTRYVALYRLRATGNRLTQGGNRAGDEDQWSIAPARRLSVDLLGRTVGVTQTVLSRGSDRRLVWSFYVVDGQIVAGALEAKLLQLRMILRRQKAVGALVMVETGIETETRDAEDILRRFLAANQPFPRYVAAVERDG